jgi:hypothetical protein
MWAGRGYRSVDADPSSGKWQHDHYRRLEAAVGNMIHLPGSGNSELSNCYLPDRFHNAGNRERVLVFIRTPPSC